LLTRFLGIPPNAKTQALYHSVRERAAYVRSGARCERVHLGRGDAAMRLFRRGDNHDVRFSGCERALSGRQLRGDRVLVGDQEPPLGSHLVTPRRGYLHHGIYVGAGKVVHYSGFAHGLRRGPVKKFLSLISRADSASG